MKPPHPFEFTAPNPADIRAARDAAEMTQAEAAAAVDLGARGRWAEYENGARSPDPVRWAIFLLITGQHPQFTLSRRRKP